jgi:hypothetical protein
MDRELEISVMRAVFGEKRVEPWIPALEAALDTADEDRRGSVSELFKQIFAQNAKFNALTGRQKELAEEAEEIRRLVNGDGGAPALDTVMRTEERVNRLHDNAVRIERESAWSFIQLMVSVRKLRKLMEDAEPGSSIRLEAQIKREAGLE